MKFLALNLMCKVVLIQVVHGFPSGPPDGACNTMLPNHGVNPQSAASPFTITASQNSYVPGDNITVTISSSGPVFKGFLIQARRADQSAVGSFTTVSNTQEKCNGGLSHSSGFSKTQLQLKWTAPSSYEGDLVFQATVVQVKTTFWTELKSGVIRDPTFNGSASSPPPNNQTVSVDLSTCGKEKGCFRNPPGCLTDCIVAATWRRPSETDNYVLFELTGKHDGWIGIGLSKDQKMGDDDVYACVHSSDTTDVNSAYNKPNTKANEYLSNRKLGLTDHSASYIDGVLSCTFKRDITVSVARRKRSDSGKVFNLDQKFNLLLGYGPVASGFIGKHDSTPLISGDQIDLRTDTMDVLGDFKLYQIHGVLMLTAWMLCINFSLIIARHYKQGWPNTKLAGKDLWFPLHTMINSLAILANVAGFVIIFIAVGGYSESSPSSKMVDKAHPPIGIAITILMFVNPIMAIFRCAPDSKNRIIFNVLHYLVGTAAQILAFVNIYFGYGLSKSSNFVDNWMTYVMAAHSVFYGLTCIVLEIHRCYIKNLEGQGKQEAYNLDKSGPSINAKEEVENSSLLNTSVPMTGLKFKYIVLSMYVIVSLALYVVMVIGIVLDIS